ncbi:hypothetical protein ESCO_006598 [Escovopsis weberi]|uniref:Uncharacterized protein n=1 Tax=Escovopsis weberi TaxID=150374 RepID=A0A0M8N1V3_ESCWE|nr:hypothetical protein ESCO_006598 [Escovopsis weberi]
MAARIPRLCRAISTLPNNTHIKVFTTPSRPSSHILTLLDTDPPSEALAIGSSTAIPPNPQSFTENRRFVAILNEVIAEFGHQDDDVVAQARALAGPGGSPPAAGISPRRETAGASTQGGAGGAGRGGFVHLSDRRNPPDFGRIAWPEDILGSVEVDGSGEVVGRLQPSGTYRMVTNEGM